jgi:hypothetical protein
VNNGEKNPLETGKQNSGNIPFFIETGKQNGAKIPLFIENGKQKGANLFISVIGVASAVRFGDFSVT